MSKKELSISLSLHDLLEEVLADTEPLKRYLLFVGKLNYPKGGMEDFEASFETEQEALDDLKKMNLDLSEMWAHIYDQEKRKFSYDSSNEAQ